MKRVGVVVAVAAVGIVAAAMLLWPRRGVGPEPIVHGSDMCAHCAMRISEAGFAGELRDPEGEIKKYDDVGCLLSGILAAKADLSEVWVEDNGDAGLVPIRMAHIVRAENARTPMGYGIVAFRSPAAARAFAEERSGAVVALGELLQNPAMWNRGFDPGQE